MKGRFQFLYCLIIAVCLCLSISAAQDDLSLGFMKFDKAYWGPVKMTIPIENLRDDSARIDVSFILLFHEHYISGLERFFSDTSLIVAPNFSGDCPVYLEMQPSIGLAVIRVKIFRQYFNPRPGDEPYEEVTQTFRSYMKIPDPAATYMNKIYSAGPMYSLQNNVLVNLDLGRIYMFKMAREERRDKVAKAFEIGVDYLKKFHDRLVEEGLFPMPNKYIPGLMAINEEEALEIKAILDARGIPLFRKWYENHGRDVIDLAMIDAGIVETARDMPSLKMALLLNIMEPDWLDIENSYVSMHFQDRQNDLNAYRRPLWIIEGGEFFLPRLCHAAFEEEDGTFYMSTFNPNTGLTYEKATIYDMRKTVSEDGIAAPIVEASQIRQALEAIKRDKRLELLPVNLKQLIYEVRPCLKKIKSYQAPYLADYVYRYILGAYFIEHPVAKGWLDCVRVDYN